MARFIRNLLLLAGGGGGIVYYNKTHKDKQLDEVVEGIKLTLQQNPSLKTGDKEQVIDQVCGQLLSKMEDDCKLIFSKYYSQFVSGQDVKIDHSKIRQAKIDEAWKKKQDE